MSEAPAAAIAAGTTAAWLRTELAAYPGRWREAFLVALAPTLAITVAATFQLEGFAASAIAYVGLQRIVVCTWRNLPRRLCFPIVTGLVMVPFGGFLLQEPWFLLPVFAVVVAATLYAFPISVWPLEGLAILYVVVLTAYAGLFDPSVIATTARDIACEVAIGMVVATVLAEILSPIRPRTRLALALAESFERNRKRFCDAIACYSAPAHALLTTEAPLFSTLSGHLQLLDLVRQEGISPDEERLFVALATAAERIESFVGTIDSLARHDVGRAYRKLLDREIGELASAIDAALLAFADEARRLDPRSHEWGKPVRAESDWADFEKLGRALETHQLELRRTGRLAGIDAAEATNTNACVRAVIALGDLLHTPPSELGHLARGGGRGEAEAAPRRWPSLPAIDPFAARYALQGGLGSTFCLIVGLAADQPALSTVLWNPVLIAQSSYGATVRRAGLRMLGVMVGSLLGLATVVLVMPNTDDLMPYLVVVFLAVALCQYCAIGTPAYWYFGFQAAISYLVVTYGIAPTVDVHVALWRVWGTLLGASILFTTYRVVAPDYAGRQLVARLRDLLRLTIDFLPAPGLSARPLGEQIERRMSVGKVAADLLRLAEEARFEGQQGIDSAAAVDAIGIAARIAYRAGLISRSRAVAPLPPLADATAALLADVQTTARDRLAADLRMLEARHTMARPGTAAHRRACERAAAIVAERRPGLAARVRAVAHHFEETHFAELTGSPPRVTGELLSAIEHYGRIAELLPRLDDALARALLPDDVALPTPGGDPNEPEHAPGLAA